MVDRKDVDPLVLVRDFETLAALRRVPAFDCVAASDVREPWVCSLGLPAVSGEVFGLFEVGGSADREAGDSLRNKTVGAIRAANGVHAARCQVVAGIVADRSREHCGNSAKEGGKAKGFHVGLVF